MKVRLLQARILMLPYPLNNFETQKYYQNKTKFDGVCSRNNLPKTKNGDYVTNLDELKSIGAHCMALCINVNNVIYFDSFGVNHIPEEIEKIIRNKNIITVIYRRQAYNLISGLYFCIGFIDLCKKVKFCQIM